MVGVPVDHLEVLIEGPVTETSVLHVFEQVRDEVAQHAVKKVLVDLRQGSVSLTISDLHTLAKMIVQRFAGTIDKIAFVARSEDILTEKFLEPSLINRGLPTLVTPDFDEAIGWLSSRLKQGR
jgi:Holliday junction resolvasome RuvABC ATP-dependent DNA helicase subunit